MYILIFSLAYLVTLGLLASVAWLEFSFADEIYPTDSLFEEFNHPFYQPLSAMLL